MTVQENAMHSTMHPSSNEKKAENADACQQ
jgi:hypothetical protein